MVIKRRDVNLAGKYLWASHMLSARAAEMLGVPVDHSFSEGLIEGQMIDVLSAIRDWRRQPNIVEKKGQRG